MLNINILTCSKAEIYFCILLFDEPIGAYTKITTSCGTAIGLVATDLCLSWPKVLNLVTVRGVTKTPV